MYPPYTRIGSPVHSYRPKLRKPDFHTLLLNNECIRGALQRAGKAWPLLEMFLLLVATICPAGATAQQVETSLPISQRFTINLAAGVPQYIGNAATASNAPQSQWWFQNTIN